MLPLILLIQKVFIFVSLFLFFMNENKKSDPLKNLISNAEFYFKSLSQLELIAWGLICVGIFLVILGIVFL